jgi:hypothetical protein
VESNLAAAIRTVARVRGAASTKKSDASILWISSTSDFQHLVKSSRYTIENQKSGVLEQKLAKDTAAGHFSARSCRPPQVTEAPISAAGDDEGPTTGRASERRVDGPS